MSGLNRYFKQPLLMSAAVMSLSVIWSPGAQATGLGLGADATVGLLGNGLELSLRLNDYISVRGGSESGKNSFTDSYEQVEYEVTVKSGGDRLTLQLHPLAGSWFFSAGFVENAVMLSAESAPNSSYTINGVTYTSTEVGTLVLDVEWPDRSVYYGMGWDWSGRNWGMKFDVGVVRQRGADVSLSATGTLAGTGAFDADIITESELLEKELDEFDTVPVVRVTLGIRF